MNLSMKHKQKKKRNINRLIDIENRLVVAKCVCWGDGAGIWD